MRGPFGALFVVTALLQGVYAAIRVLISYKVLELDGSARDLGVLVAVYALAPLVLALRVGRLNDRGYNTSTMRVGGLLSLAGVALVAVSPNLFVLGVASVLLGCGQMASMIAAQGLIPRIADEVDFDRRFATWSVAIALGQTLAVPLVGVIIAAAPTRAEGMAWSLLFLGVLCAVASALVFGRSLRFAALEARATDPPPQALGAMLKVPGMRAAMFASAITLAAIELLIAYLPLLGQEMGFGVLAVTLIITARSIASLVAKLFMGPLLRWIGRTWLLIGAAAVSAPLIGGLAWAPTPWLVAVAVALSGFVWGFGQPLSMTWIAGLVTPGNRAAALSLRLTGNRVGQIVIPVGAGVVAGSLGVAALFAVLGGLLLVSAGSTARALLRGDKPPEADG